MRFRLVIQPGSITSEENLILHHLRVPQTLTITSPRLGCNKHLDPCESPAHILLSVRRTNVCCSSRLFRLEAADWCASTGGTVHSEPQTGSSAVFYSFPRCSDSVTHLLFIHPSTRLFKTHFITLSPTFTFCCEAVVTRENGWKVFS